MKITIKIKGKAPRNPFAAQLLGTKTVKAKKGKGSYVRVRFKVRDV